MFRHSLSRLQYLALLLTALSTHSLAGEGPLPFVHPLFCDHMVLQRGMADPIWGWAAPGEKVTLSIADKTAMATTGPDGKWMAKIGPLAAGGPFTLTIEGSQKIVINDVLVGDVWLSSGQSNMEFGLGGVANSKAEVADTVYPNLRLFKVGHFMYIAPRKLMTGAWAVSSPDTANGFSAVSYLFGRGLHKELNVPIGMIDASLGSTICEAWTSVESMSELNKNNPNNRIFGDWLLKKAVDLYEREPEVSKDYTDKYKAWWNQDPGIKKPVDWSKPGVDTRDWKTLPKLSVLPLDECKSGVVWFKKRIDLPEYYQGKDLDVKLGCFRGDDNVWINGQKFSRSTGWHNYRVPKELVKNGSIEVTIRNWNTEPYSDHTVGCWFNAGQLFVSGEGAKPLAIGDDWKYFVAINGAANPCPPMFIKVETSDVAGAFNGMLSPLIPFGIKGAIWYQGEFNAGNPDGYRKLLPNMIGDWRSRFGAGDFPFYIVQLPNNGRPQTDPNSNLGWAEMRAAEADVANTVQNSGVAVSVDTSTDGSLHPREKADIAKRLVLIAMEKTYGKPIESSGPVFHDMKVEGNRIRVAFDHVGGGLFAKGDVLKGFAITGADKKFVWADAAIDGKTVVVSATGVEAPTMVRYAWGGNPPCTLYNKEGLPAMPFKTDK